jgi:hypothetical protein
MKKTHTAKRTVNDEEEMRADYHCDYRKGKLNRFAARFPRGASVVVLDADVAAVFSTPESVNAVLRALIETMPAASSQK